MRCVLHYLSWFLSFCLISGKRLWTFRTSCQPSRLSWLSIPQKKTPLQLNTLLIPTYVFPHVISLLLYQLHPLIALWTSLVLCKQYFLHVCAWQLFSQYTFAYGCGMTLLVHRFPFHMSVPCPILMWFVPHLSNTSPGSGHWRYKVFKICVVFDPLSGAALLLSLLTVATWLKGWFVDQDELRHVPEQHKVQTCLLVCGWYDENVAWCLSLPQGNTLQVYQVKLLCLSYWCPGWHKGRLLVPRSGWQLSADTRDAVQLGLPHTTGESCQPGSLRKVTFHHWLYGSNAHCTHYLEVAPIHLGFSLV